MIPMRPFASLLIAALVGGCNDAVTDPLRSDFRSDPAPVLGAWRTADFGGLEPELYDARVDRGAGLLRGTFEYPLHGRFNLVQFSDGIWNGSAIVFQSVTDFGFTLPDSTVSWLAEVRPGQGAPGAPGWVPTQLVLTASTVDGPAFHWTYLRPADFAAFYGVGGTAGAAGARGRRPRAENNASAITADTHR